MIVIKLSNTLFYFYEKPMMLDITTMTFNLSVCPLKMRKMDQSIDVLVWIGQVNFQQVHIF